MPNRQERRRAWPKRRAILDAVATDTRLTSGCKTFLLLLCRRSDDTAKPVWGAQTKMADQLGRSDRTVRRYRAELETLGYLTVYRSKPQRGPDGRWHRRRSNTYYLHLAPTDRQDQDAPRRRQRAPYSVLPHRRAGQYAPGRGRRDNNPRTVAPAHLPDSDDRSSPFGGEITGGSPPTTTPPEPPPDAGPPNQADRDAAHRRFAELRALLRPPQPQPKTTSAV